MSFFVEAVNRTGQEKTHSAIGIGHKNNEHVCLKEFINAVIVKMRPRLECYLIYENMTVVEDEYLFSESHMN